MPGSAKNYVVSTWIHGPDPQREGAVESKTPSELASVTLGPSISGAEFVILESKINDTNVYLDRWKVQHDWLVRNEDINFVWFVDIGDVTMLREPWDAMDKKMLYMGDTDPTMLNHSWVLEHHPAPFLQDFVRSTDETLLGPGTTGGSREIMLEFHAAMLTLLAEHGSDLGWDVGPANWVVYNLFKDRFVTGPQVVNQFKSYRDNGVTWWMHK